MNYLDHPEVTKALDAVKEVRADLAEAHRIGISNAAKELETALGRDGPGQDLNKLAEKVVATYERVTAEQLGQTLSGSQLQTETVRI